MSIAILALIGAISTAQAVEAINTSNWPDSDLTCHFNIDRLNKGDGGDWENHTKGKLFQDKTFPANKSSLFWKEYQSSSVRGTYDSSTVSW